MKVLVAENSLPSLNHLCDLLEKDGFETVRAENGRQALAAYKDSQPDFICLDIMMPDVSGFDVCRDIRKVDVKTPIIFISSKVETASKVHGLDIGGDDYIVKPFDIQEVMARMRAVARRCLAAMGPQNDSFRIGGLEVHPGKLRAERDGRFMDLSLRDIKILRLLFDHKNEVVSRDALLDYCWGRHIMPESRTVDWHISQLRKRIERDPATPLIIRTIHGAGYRYEEPEAP